MPRLPVVYLSAALVSAGFFALGCSASPAHAEGVSLSWTAGNSGQAGFTLSSDQGLQSLVGSLSQAYATSNRILVTAQVKVADGYTLDGTVVLKNSHVAVASQAVMPDGTATFSFPVTSVASLKSLTATYINARFGSIVPADISISITITLGKAETETNLTLDSESQTYASTATILATATVPPVDGVNPEGSMVFSRDGNQIAEVPVDDGRATYVLPANTPSGTHQLVATFTPADSSLMTSTSATRDIVIRQGETETVLTLSRAAQRYGSAHPIEAKAMVHAPDGANPDGTFVFSKNGNVLAKVASSDGVGIFKFSKTAAAGSYDLSVAFIPADRSLRTSISNTEKVIVREFKAAGLANNDDEESSSQQGDEEATPKPEAAAATVAPIPIPLNILTTPAETASAESSTADSTGATPADQSAAPSVSSPPAQSPHNLGSTPAPAASASSVPQGDNTPNAAPEDSSSPHIPWGFVAIGFAALVGVLALVVIDGRRWMRSATSHVD